jgi:hypothetical protein
MTISDELRQQVRQRAKFACEFCGISLEEQQRLLEEQRFLLQLLLRNAES